MARQGNGWPAIGSVRTAAKSHNYLSRRRVTILASASLVLFLAVRALPYGPLGGPRGPTTTTPPPPARATTPTSREACRRPPTTRSEALAWLAGILDENRVDYFLAYGTLLGAVRDGTIVPWTCDVDVMVPDLRAPRVQRLFRDLVCDDRGPDGPARCAGYCAVGQVGDGVFHLRFNPDAVEVEPCPGRGGGRGPKRRPGLRRDGQINNVPGAPIYMDVYSIVQMRGNPRPLYFVGSKGNGNPSGNVFAADQIYPLNLTGATVDGRQYPSPRDSEAVLEAKYGRGWRTPDSSWERGWCLAGWCWTRRGIFRVAPRDSSASP